MAVKTITDPAGRTFRFGRNRPVGDFTKFRMARYMSAPLPTAPDCDYTTQAGEALGQIYGNDIYGDCVIACAGHLFGVLKENAEGNRSIFSDGEIINQYSKCCGFVPGEPWTDEGCDVQAVLNDILQHGFKGHRKVGEEKIKVDHHIAGWLAVDGSNKEEVRQAVWLFENLIFGVCLPDAWITPFPSSSGFTWGVAGPADPENGHCFLGCSTNSVGVGIATWGMTGLVTYKAVAEYTVAANDGELYVAISQEMINKAQAKSPAGFDFAQLAADFESLGGTVSA